MSKVNVITVEQAAFPRFAWWSNWIDIAVFNFGGEGYLLQMHVSRRNKKQFRAAPFQSRISAVYATTDQAGDLTQMEGAVPA